MTYLPRVSQHCTQEVKLRTGLFTNISVFFFFTCMRTQEHCGCQNIQQSFSEKFSNHIAEGEMTEVCGCISVGDVIPDEQQQKVCLCQSQNT